MELVVPGVGQIVNLEDETECALALEALRDFESQIKSAKVALTEALVERSRVLGTKTLTLSDGSKAEIKGGSTTLYDAERLEEELRARGCPEERIRAAIKEEVTYKVDGRVVKQLAAANIEYAEAVEHARSEVERAHYVSVQKRR